MRIIIIIGIAVVLGLLLLSVQDPVFLAGGSDSLDISIVPNPLSQWFALILFIMSIIHIFIVKYGSKPLGIVVKTFILFFATIIFLISGHTYTISGKQHAFIDQWFHIPVQRLEINPTGSIEQFAYKDNSIFICIYDKDEIKQRIVLGPLIWGIQFDDIKLKLEKFGVKKMKKGESATPELSGSGGIQDTHTLRQIITE